MTTTTALVSRLEGVTAVLVTPFSDRMGPVDPGVLRTLTERVDAAGVHCLTALGNTAEVFQLAPDERRVVLTTVAEGRRAAALLAGVGGELSAVLAQCRDAAELGFDAVMLHEPPDPLASSTGTAAYITEVLDRSPLPVVLYIRTRRLEPGTLGDLVAHPNAVAVKHAVPDVAAVAELLGDARVRAACTWICGSAESMVPMYAAHGITGFTSGLANVRPDLALALWRAIAERRLGDMQELYGLLLPFELLRIRGGSKHNIAVVKHALERDGFAVGGVRPPCEDLDGATVERLHAVLRAWDDAEVALASTPSA